MLPTDDDDDPMMIVGIVHSRQRRHGGMAPIAVAVSKAIDILATLLIILLAVASARAAWGPSNTLSDDEAQSLVISSISPMSQSASPIDDEAMTPFQSSESTSELLKVARSRSLVSSTVGVTHQGPPASDALPADDPSFTLIFAQLLNGGVCQKGNDDWRSRLPRFIAKELSESLPEGASKHRFQSDSRLVTPIPAGLQATNRVIVWNAKQSIGGGVREDCQVCTAEGIIGERRSAKPFSCSDYFTKEAQAGRSTPDMVVVIGSGRDKAYSSLLKIFEQPWINTSSTRFIHIPITRDENILKNRVAPFDKVLPDESWVKPIHMDDIPGWKKECEGVVRDNTLAYIARYHDFKVRGMASDDNQVGT